MRQKSIGEVLKTARELRGLSLVELQKMTKIQVKYLQALEYNDFEFIPDQTYTRSFLKKYAEAVDLDASVILDAYDQNRLVRYYDEELPPDGGSGLSRSYKQKRKIESYLPLVYLLLAAFLIILFVSYIVYGRLQYQTTSVSPSRSYTVVSSTIEETSQEESSSTSETSTSSSSSTKETTLTTTGSGNAISVTVSNATKPIQVELSVVDVTSWVSLTDTDLVNGTTLSETNQKTIVTIPDDVNSTRLTLGVVEGVTVKIAGKTLDTSALTSQTGTITITIE